MMLIAVISAVVLGSCLARMMTEETRECRKNNEAV